MNAYCRENTNFIFGLNGSQNSPTILQDGCSSQGPYIARTIALIFHSQTWSFLMHVMGSRHRWYYLSGKLTNKKWQTLSFKLGESFMQLEFKNKTYDHVEHTRTLEGYAYHLTFISPQETITFQWGSGTEW